MQRNIILLFIIFCNMSFVYANNTIVKLINNGELSNAITECDAIMKISAKNSKAYFKADSLKQIAQRIYIDFSRNEASTDSIILKRIGQFTAAQKQIWENNKWLEHKIIDGKKLYFKNAVGNLKLRLIQVNDSINPNEKKLDNFEKFKIDYVNGIYSKGNFKSKPTQSKTFNVKYTVTLQPNSLPEGETIRCWLPWPKESHKRQSDVKLKNTFPEKHQISEPNTDQRSIYFEQQAVKDKPTVFYLEFAYKSYAQYFDLSNKLIKSYNKNSALYKKYTAEQQPHIIFTNNLKSLTDKITGNETNPYKIVKLLFQYISKNYIWSSALEYSIMPNIPAYVIENRRGDCGMKTLLFMTMARYKGIPVKWQSGWMMHPEEVNLHDWCEVYYENIGWVPLDMSFGILDSTDEKISEFYMQGIDAYRMIVNDDISSPLHPKKEYLRSEPYDFQRGEMEWKEGNLYFNMWNYNMEVEYK